MKAGSARNRAVQLAWVFASVLAALGLAECQDQAAGWQQQVRDQVAAHHLDVALVLVDERLKQNDADLEARFWRGRLLAWQGQWAAAESEYKLVLEHAPNDSDVLAALADVLRWQKRSDDALVIIDRARAIAPTQPEILLRRARILHGLGRHAEAQRQYREILRIDPHNREARALLEARAAEANTNFGPAWILPPLTTRVWTRPRHWPLHHAGRTACRAVSKRTSVSDLEKERPDL